MFRYYAMPDEVVWSDLRHLIQSGIQHIRNQKNARGVQNSLDWGREVTFALDGDEDALEPIASPRSLPANNSALFKISAIPKLPPPPSYHVGTSPTPSGTYPQPPYLILLFRFLQSLCADHDKVIQAYLSSQSDNFQNVDLIRESSLFLRMIDDFANPDTIDVIESVVLFMQDVAIGSKQNQVWLRFCVDKYFFFFFSFFFFFFF
jgi:hypothetical protein